MYSYYSVLFINENLNLHQLLPAYVICDKLGGVVYGPINSWNSVKISRTWAAIYLREVFSMANSDTMMFRDNTLSIQDVDKSTL